MARAPRAASAGRAEADAAGADPGGAGPGGESPCSAGRFPRDDPVDLADIRRWLQVDLAEHRPEHLAEAGKRLRGLPDVDDEEPGAAEHAHVVGPGRLVGELRAE